VDHIFELVNVSRGGALVGLGEAPRPRWLELHHGVEIRLFDGEGRVVLEASGTIVRIEESVTRRLFALRFEAPVDDEIIRRALRTAGRPPPLPIAGTE
jgi:hypothetical protein